MEDAYPFSWLPCGVVMLILLAMGSTSTADIKYFDFHVGFKNITRLCHSKPLLTVNGQYPGPTIPINEGDDVAIKVSNHVMANTTLHWHGIRQYRTGWADGPAYITQCPIQRGHSYTYKFKVTQQRGTLLWHAHISWQRASVHGAFIIHPKIGIPYPFPKPDVEVTVIFGEWWNADVEAVEKESIRYGSGPNVSDAYTTNGLPGPFYPCSYKDTFVQLVDRGKTYLLRLISAALNDELFFAIANHTLTVVEIDACYVKPFSTKAIMIAPGQTMNVLLTANQPAANYMMAAHPYASAPFPFDNTTTISILQYSNSATEANNFHFPGLICEGLPLMHDTAFATRFTAGLRSLNSPEYPSAVPKKVDRRLNLIISLNRQDCPPGKLCKGYLGGRFSASINNQSFIRPRTSILQAAYYNLSGIFSRDFPSKPSHEYNYTAASPGIVNLNPEFSTRVAVIPYNADVEMILQGNSFVGFENHPIHVHGFNFYVVGQGFGNFNSQRDPASFNVVDPPLRNTVGVPTAGWVALRFKADNPGVWFVHCHLEAHTTWGLAMAFMVENGPAPEQAVLPPPSDLPPC